MTSSLRLFAVFDAIIIAACLGGAALAIPLLRSHEAKEVVIYHDQTETAVYPLNIDRMISIHGNNGPVRIAIARGAVKIASANCPKGICAHTSPIAGDGRQIVCVPNHILIRVRSQRTSASLPDAIAQ